MQQEDRHRCKSDRRLARKPRGAETCSPPPACPAAAGHPAPLPCAARPVRGQTVTAPVQAMPAPACSAESSAVRHARVCGRQHGQESSSAQVRNTCQGQVTVPCARTHGHSQLPPESRATPPGKPAARGRKDTGSDALLAGKPGGARGCPTRLRHASWKVLVPRIPAARLTLPKPPSPTQALMHSCSNGSSRERSSSTPAVTPAATGRAALHALWVRQRTPLG